MRRAQYRGHVITLVVTLLFVGAFAFGLLTWSGNAPWVGGYEVKVLAPTAGSMGSGANVRIAGIGVGKVTAVQRLGSAAELTMKIYGAHTPLPEDTRAAVRLRTLVGENYVELIPGKSPTDLPSGGTLPMAQAENYVEADQILSVLRGKTRDRAREMFRGLGTALDGQGNRLNAFLEGSFGTLEAADDVSLVLSNDHQQVGALVDDLGRLMRAIGDRGDSLARLASAGKATFEALAARDVALNETLQQLPPTLKQVRDTSNLLGSVTGESAPVLFDLAGAVEDLDPAVSHLKRAADEGNHILNRLGTTAPDLEGTLGRVRTLAGPTTEALPELRKVLCELNPTAEYLSPYAKDFAAMLTNMAGATNFYDATGHAGRMLPMAGPQSAGFYSDAMLEALTALEDVGFVQKLVQQGYNPYPKPGTAGQTEVGAGANGPSQSKIPYERVKAEC